MDDELIFWLLFFCVGFPLLVIVLAFLLNPDFWQGYRNTKWIDELSKDKKKPKSKPKHTKEIIKYE